MIQMGPFYILLVVLLIFLVKIIDCGQLIIKQRVSFNPILNSLYYIIGVFSVLMIFTMFNERGLIYHRLMMVILLALSTFIFIPSVFVKPTKNSIISTAIITILAIVLSAITYFSMDNPQDGTLIGFAVYFGIFIIIGAIFHNLLNKINKKGKKVLFYKQKLWELLNNRLLLVPIFSLVCIEFALQFVFGETLLFFLPI